MGVRIYVGEMGCEIYLSKSENTAVFWFISYVFTYIFSLNGGF